MANAEGRAYAFLDETAISPECLETIPYNGETQTIRYETREFSAVCPFSF